MNKNETMFSINFNCIPLKLIEKAYPDGITEKILKPPGWFYEGEKENEENTIPYPMWGWVFEAKELYIAEKIKDNIDKLAKLGIFILDIEELHTTIYPDGCGMNFYDVYWKPMFEILGISK